jgi:hypothetical protein
MIFIFDANRARRPSYVGRPKDYSLYSEKFALDMKLTEFENALN